MLGPVKGKAPLVTKQTTLFGLPPGAPATKKGKPAKEPPASVDSAGGKTTKPEEEGRDGDVRMNEDTLDSQATEQSESTLEADEDVTQVDIAAAPEETMTDSPVAVDEDTTQVETQVETQIVELEGFDEVC